MDGNAAPVGARAFAAAQALVGARFRLHGRQPATGLDCVGVVLAAYAAAGAPLVAQAGPDAAPADYPLRGWPLARALALVERSALVPVLPGAALRCGDVALILPGAGQIHFAMLGVTTMVHAHAALRRVVAVPMPPGAASLRRWRHPDMEV